MLRPIQTPEKNLPLQFPLKGIDSSNEYSNQPDSTTIEGQNVRAFDAIRNRARGGSRTGTSRFIDEFVDSAGFPVQCLGLVVMISEDAMLDDFGVNDFGPSGDIDDTGGGGGSGQPPGPGPDDDDFEDDDSTDNNRRRKPIGGRRIRRRGSGVRPTRNGKKPSRLPPTAAADSASLGVGTSVSVNPLANDTYSGTPRVKLKNVPSLAGGTITVTGTGTATRVLFSAGSIGTFVVPYILTASGNTGNSRSTITFVVTDFPPPTYPKTYSNVGVVTLIVGDGFADITISDGSGLPGGSTIYHITANGPGSGEPGAIDIFIASFNQLDGISVGSHLTITVTGTLDTGYEGNIVVQ